MILFFFLLLMLAMAWGVADHFQSIVRKEPPPVPPPTRIEAPARPQPIPVSPDRSVPGGEEKSATSDQPASTTATADTDAAPAASTTEKP